MPEAPEVNFLKVHDEMIEPQGKSPEFPEWC